MKYKDTIFTQYSDSVIESIIEEQQNDDEDDDLNKIKILIIMDDILGELKNTSAIWRLLPIHRHLNVSFIFAGQIFRGTRI